jgi:hypothetical protein
LGLLSLVFNVLEFTGVIPDPLSFLLSLLSGRSTMEATYDQAKSLITYQSPVLKMLGLGSGRLLELGIPISSPAAAPIFGPYFRVANQLESQIRFYDQSTRHLQLSAATLGRVLFEAGNPGVTNNITTHEVESAWTSLNSAEQRSVQEMFTGTRGPPDMSEITDLQAQLTGCQANSNYRETILLKVIASYDAAVKAEEGLYTKLQTAENQIAVINGQLGAAYKDIALYQQEVKQDAQNIAAYQAELTKTADELFAANTAWNKCRTQLAACEAQQQNGAGTGAGDGDELTDFAGQVEFGLACICTAIKAISFQAGTDPTCCAKLVAVIATVTNAFTPVTVELAAIAAAARTPINLTPVVVALDNLVTAQRALLVTERSDAAAVYGAIQDVAAAISGGEGTDLTQVVEQLKALVAQGDVKQSILDYLTKEGYLSGADAQVIAGAPWADAIVGIFRTALWNAWTWLIKAAGVGSYTTRFVLGTLEDSIIAWIAEGVNAALKAGADPIYPIVKGLIDGVVVQLNPTAAVQIGNVHVDPDLLLAKTLAPILIINGMALLADYFGWEISEQLREYVTIAAEFIGLAEIKELQVGARMRFGPVRVAEMHARAIYRQELPAATAGYMLAARGLIPRSFADTLATYQGLPAELVKPIATAAYSGLNARQMLRLIETDLFTSAEIADELTFAGMRTVSQQRMLHAAPYLATQPQRHQLEAEIQKAYVDGLFTDADVVDQTDAAEQNMDRNSLILNHARLQKYAAGALMLSKEYSKLYLANLIDEATYRANLAGAGFEPDWVNALMARDEVTASVTLARQEASAARALAKATAGAERQTAIKQFKAGNINAAALTAALLLTGLTPIQTAAMLSLAQIDITGLPRWIYGLHLPPAQASLLRQRVSDLLRQREILGITDAQFTTALQALKLPPKVINALRAQADAHITPKSSAIVLTVETG